MDEAYRPSNSLQDYRKSHGVSRFEGGISQAAAMPFHLAIGVVRESITMVLR
jgi:hypothetical protein